MAKIDQMVKKEMVEKHRKIGDFFYENTVDKNDQNLYWNVYSMTSKYILYSVMQTVRHSNFTFFNLL